MAEQYKKTKSDYDNKAFVYLMKRLFEDVSETDACNSDIIDSLGNKIADPDKNDKWAFTMLDQFMMLIKSRIGANELKILLSNFEYTKFIDPLFIINMKSGTNLHKVKDAFDTIISTVHDKSYLPENLYHSDDSYVELNGDEMNYCDHLSKALTIGTYLIYAIRLDRLPNEVEFDGNILASVETTFNVRSIGTYNEIKDFCDKNKLVEYDRISKEGIQLVVKLAKIAVDGNLLSTSKDRIESQNHNWKRLAGVSN